MSVPGALGRLGAKCRGVSEPISLQLHLQLPTDPSTQVTLLFCLCYKEFPFHNRILAGFFSVAGTSFSPCPFTSSLVTLSVLVNKGFFFF